MHKEKWRENIWKLFECKFHCSNVPENWSYSGNGGIQSDKISDLSWQMIVISPLFLADLDTESGNENEKDKK